MLVAMTLENPTPEQLERMREELKEDANCMKQQVAHLRHWLSKQPHLPQHMEDARLERFLYGCKLDVARTKRVLDTYYTVRSSVPEFFADRDSISLRAQQCICTVDYIPLPVLTPNGYRATLLRIRDSNPDKFDVRSLTTRILNSLDLRMLLEERCLNNIMLIDLQNFTMAHYSKLSPTHALSRKALLCIQDAFPLRLAEVHFLNAPSVIGNIMNLFRPFLKEKLFRKFHFHTGPEFDSLYPHVPRSALPSDYDRWNDRLENMRTWFLEEQKISKSDESRRPPGSRGFSASALAQGVEVHGTFRQLSID
ncbi:hypothetical protein C0J52_10516 [Blattella germanica]|nr:hypothetical protein C0J52_10516 [Blattella germanica]